MNGQFGFYTFESTIEFCWGEVQTMKFANYLTNTDRCTVTTRHKILRKILYTRILHMVHYLAVVWGLACSDDTLSFANLSFTTSGVTHAGSVKRLGARLNVDQTGHKDRTNIDVSGMKIVRQGRFPPCHQTQVGWKRQPRLSGTAPHISTQ